MYGGKLCVLEGKWWVSGGMDRHEMRTLDAMWGKSKEKELRIRAFG